MADGAPIKRGGKYCVAGSRDNVSCISTRYSPGNIQWATKVLRHFVIFEYLRQISFLISTILPPRPFSMLNFLSLEFASFLYNIENGGGVWLST